MEKLEFDFDIVLKKVIVEQTHQVKNIIGSPLKGEYKYFQEFNLKDFDLGKTMSKSKSIYKRLRPENKEDLLVNPLELLEKLDLSKSKFLDIMKKLENPGKVEPIKLKLPFNRVCRLPWWYRVEVEEKLKKEGYRIVSKRNLIFIVLGAVIIGIIWLLWDGLVINNGLEKFLQWLKDFLNIIGDIIAMIFKQTPAGDVKILNPERKGENEEVTTSTPTGDTESSTANVAKKVSKALAIIPGKSLAIIPKELVVVISKQLVVFMGKQVIPYMSTALDIYCYQPQIGDE